MTHMTEEPNDVMAEADLLQSGVPAGEEKHVMRKKKKIDPLHVIFILAFTIPSVVYFCVFYVYVNFNSFVMAFQTRRQGTLYWTLEHYRSDRDSRGGADSYVYQPDIQGEHVCGSGVGTGHEHGALSR